MSFKGIDKVSLLTLEGRVIVPLIMGAYQAERFGGAKRARPTWSTGAASGSCSPR